MAQVLILATLATKEAEATYLERQIKTLGLTARCVDISLQNGGDVLSGDAKQHAMRDAAQTVLAEVVTSTGHDAEVFVAIGGGTGGAIALQVLQALPITFPKLLVTTLPFDPRAALADNSIIVIPTLADICGLNAILREVLDNTAHCVAGLCQKTRKGALTDVKPSVGITALGSTDAAVKPILQGLRAQGREATVFHANGFGGAAFARFAAQNAFDAIIDLTPHEITRLHLDGVAVDMPDRFTAGSDLPRVVLPGAMNFIGLGPRDTVPATYLDRPFYEHSGYFTHIKVTEAEMVRIASKLADHLNALTGPTAVIVPMGGFSHEDRPGGAIEDPALRDLFLHTMRAELGSHIPLAPLPTHLFDPSTTDSVLTTLQSLSES